MPITGLADSNILFQRSLQRFRRLLSISIMLLAAGFFGFSSLTRAISPFYLGCNQGINPFLEAVMVSHNRIIVLEYPRPKIRPR
jgi:hypothetical protein